MSLSEYRRLAQKNDEENYLLDKLIFRKISIFATIACIRIKMTPNQATFISLVCALASLYFLAYNSRFHLLMAAALILFYYLMDHVDGELARYYIRTGTMQPSLAGHYFDVLVHRYSSNLMCFFLSLGIWRAYGYTWAVLLGFLSCIGISSFPNVVAAQIIAGSLARNRQLAAGHQGMEHVLAVLETKKAQIEAVRHSSLTGRLKKLVAETLFFPGHILLLVVILLLDAFIPGLRWGSFSFNLRLVFLLLFTALYSAKTILQSILWMKRLRDI